ncbi:MAG TPA: hypothetical protein PKH75_11135 [Bacillota bacterium]|nr:hypothetical protein [Bacillota bacterium]HOL13240.1 hypothetical protein [Bacillota bacterium]
MARTLAAVLLDTTGIQRYIFSSNKLKENLGASHLVGNIYHDELGSALRESLGVTPDLESWKEKPNQVQMANDEQVFEVGYIGGGNALLFFRSREAAERFVAVWTKRLLLNAPGVSTAVAIDDFDIDDFAQERERLLLQLAKNKNRYFPATTLPKHGITADCPLSGGTGEIPWTEPGTHATQYISNVSYTKMNAAEKAREDIRKQFAHVLGHKYTFTDETNKLGQIEGHDYVAVVHIDGNRMGARFRQCKDLATTRQLSQDVVVATSQAFAELLKEIIARMDDLDAAGIKTGNDVDGKRFLPVRSIVLDGDDITFATDGRLGVYLAERFMHHAGQKVLSDGRPMHFCAGVAIFKSQYPFFRGYQMAVDLCSSAKRAERQWRRESCWLDFHIVHGGKSGRLTAIRDGSYRAGDGGHLVFGPYLLHETDQEKSLRYLKMGMRALRHHWPRSKLKQLRRVLSEGRQASKEFISLMKARGLYLPETPKGYADDGWQDATPYFAMVELMEFYPETLIVEEGEEH